MIPFNKPPVTGEELEYIKDVIENGHLCGDGKYTKLCHEWLEKNTGTKKALLTTSCTHALEMAALLLNVQPDDEIIMPSYTFVSTANAFVLRGARIVFVDIRPDTMNIDETKIEEAITNKTKVIVPVHYAGVACEMDTIMDIAKRYKLFVVEDAAQGIMATYKGQMLGTIGHLGTYSFHETKNIVCGEGGALLINDDRFIERAEIIREKGTNRLQFSRGEVDKYTWRDIGSSYLLSEINAAHLYAQLNSAFGITENRINIWNVYYKKLKPLELEGKLELPVITSDVVQNGHIFFIKLPTQELRNDLLKSAKENEIAMSFHYIPLHSSPFGKKHGLFIGEDVYTTKCSERIVRLPLLYNLTLEQIEYVVENIYKILDDKG